VIVADTNVVAYLLVEGERTEAARRVFQRDPDWRLPPLWRSEFLNVLVVAVRAGAIDRDQASQAWQAAASLFDEAERAPDGEEVLTIALRSKLSAYDAQFVAVAEELDVPLITGDRRIVAACPGRAVSLEEFGAGGSS